jgi:hypothetical protein
VNLGVYFLKTARVPCREHEYEATVTVRGVVNEKPEKGEHSSKECFFVHVRLSSPLIASIAETSRSLCQLSPWLQ